MKRISTITGLVLGCTFFSFAQREIDLETILLTPNEDAYIAPMEPFNMQVSIYNNGSVAYNADDSLAYYLLFDGDTLTFQPGNENHTEHTGFSLLPGESHTLNRTMVFDTSFEGADVEICVYAWPFNAADPIADQHLDDSQSCSLVHVSSQAGVSEKEAVSVQVFPNPAKGLVTVQSKVAIRSVSVTDVSGKPVDLPQTVSEMIDCSELRNGVYFIRVETANGISVKRLAIVN